jgi:autotransporter-associated beta strand protein
VQYTNVAPDPAATNSLSALQLSSVAGSSTFTMAGGTLSITNTGANAVPIGNANGATATFTMSDGVLNVLRNASNFFQDIFIVGNSPNASPWNANGTFTLNGGQANIFGGIEIGTAGTGTININGGTFVDNGWFGVGRGGNSTNSQAFVNITGGAVFLLRNPSTENGANGIAFNQGSTNAVFTMSGGTVYAYGFRFSQSGSAGRTDHATVNISGGDLYLSGVGVLNQGATGTHINTINLSGGTFHTLNLGPNTTGTPGITLGTNSVATGGTNWAWSAPLTASLNTSPGPGVVTFAPDTGRTITLNNVFNGAGGLTLAGPGTVALNGNNNYTGPTLLTGGTLSGIGVIQGSLTASPNTIIAPGASVTVGTLTLGNNLSLSGNTNIIKLSGDPATIGGTANDLMAVNGDVTLTAPVTIKIVPLAPLSTAQPYTVLSYSGAALTAADGARITVISDSPRYNFTVIDPSTTPGTIQIQIGGNAADLVWKGTISSALWDNATANWLNAGTSASDIFYNGDKVTFDDTSMTNLVNIPAPEQPGLITMANNSTAYTWIGGGPLAGPLDMEGTGSLTLAKSNAPAFTGITNNSGSLIFNMLLPSYAIAAPITDNGNALGALVKADTNTMILQGNNGNYTGVMIITNGVLQYTSANGVGQPQYPLFATNNGTLDVNNVSPGLKNIILSGTGYNGLGAIYNSGGGALQNNSGIKNVTLAGDTSIGSATRFDFSQSMFAGNGYNLTEVGPVGHIFVDIGDTALGNIHLMTGRLGFQGNVTMGDPTKLCVVESNATLTLFATTNSTTADNGESKVVVLNGFAQFDSGGASNNFDGPIFLSKTNLFGTRSKLHISAGISDTNGPGSLLLGTDSVGASAADLYLDGVNTYSGATIITNRTLFLGASSSIGSSTPISIITPGALNVSAVSSFQLNSGQILTGNGTVTGNVTVNNGATVAAGASGSTASLTMSGNLAFQTGSTNIVAVNKTTSIANSKVVGLASVSAGGTLVVNATGNPLAGGDAIQLFSSLGTYGGSFNTIIPSTPGTGLAWDSSTIGTDGTLRVISNGPALNATNIVWTASGHSLTLSWPSDHTGWTLQAQTNSLTGAWFTVPGSSSTNLLIIPIDPANIEVFYRMILNP